MPPKRGCKNMQLICQQAHMLYIFALFTAFINNKSLFQSFGFYNERPIMIGFLLFSDALAPMDAVVKLLMNILSRKFEFEAGSLYQN
jgi:STE24 endopeptidase